MQQQQKHKQQQQQQMSIELSENNLKPSVTMGGLKIKASLQNATSTSTTTNIAHPTTTTSSSSSSSSSLTSVSCPLTSIAVAVIPSTTVSTTTGYSNSLLKQQLRSSLKEVPITTNNNNNNNNKKINCNANDGHVMNAHEACTALQSLAHAAERQANNIQPPTANNLHHQFMLHMAANPILKPTTGGEYYQQHQQQSQQQEQLLLKDDDHNMDLLLDHNNDDKSDPEMLTLADENAGLDFTLNIGNNGEPQMLVEKHLNTENNLTINGNNNSNNKSTTGRASSKPIQRRRIRRKAQSSLDDPAEQLTEMSVRGLDLFRYASISEGVYQCTECAKENLQKTFKNKYSFQRHAFLYHEGKQRKVFPCTLCGKGFSRPDKMKNHIKMVHEVANFNSLNYLITAAAGELSTVTAAAAAKATQAGMRQSTATNNCSQLNVVPSPTPLGEKSRSEGCGSAGDETKLLLHNNKLLTDNVTYSPDIEIKNEIIISPSPSPPPLTALDAATQKHQHQQNLQLNHHSQAVTVIHNVSKSLLKMTAPQSTQTHTASQLSNNAQRLEEVK